MGKGSTFEVVSMVLITREYKVLTGALKPGWIMSQMTEKPSSIFAEYLGACESVFTGVWLPSGINPNLTGSGLL